MKSNKFLIFLRNLFKEKQYLDLKWMHDLESRIEHLEYLIDQINPRNKR